MGKTKRVLYIRRPANLRLCPGEWVLATVAVILIYYMVAKFLDSKKA